MSDTALADTPQAVKTTATNPDAYREGKNATLKQNAAPRAPGTHFEKK